jgi:hypothetical protein
VGVGENDTAVSMNPSHHPTPWSKYILDKLIFILKGSDDGVMHLEESCFRTLSIVHVFFFKNNVSETDSASVFR